MAPKKPYPNVPQNVCYGSALEGNISYQNAFAVGEVIRNELLPELAAANHDLEGEELLKHGERLIDEKITPVLKELGMDLSTMVDGDL